MERMSLLPYPVTIDSKTHMRIASVFVISENSDKLGVCLTLGCFPFPDGGAVTGCLPRRLLVLG